MFTNKVSCSIILGSKGALGAERKVLAKIKIKVYIRIERFTWGAL